MEFSQGGPAARKNLICGTLDKWEKFVRLDPPAPHCRVFINQKTPQLRTARLQLKLQRCMSFWRMGFDMVSRRDPRIHWSHGTILSASDSLSKASDETILFFKHVWPRRFAPPPHHEACSLPKVETAVHSFSCHITCAFLTITHIETSILWVLHVLLTKSSLRMVVTIVLRNLPAYLSWYCISKLICSHASTRIGTNRSSWTL